MPADDFTFDYHYALTPPLYDREYQIGIRIQTNGRGRVVDFATLLFWVRSDGRVVEVARIDNRTHPEDDRSGPHIHRLYREQSRHVRDYDIAASKFEDTEPYLEAEFERFARQYQTTHGDEIVAYEP